jgi:hypothetical protein
MSVAGREMRVAFGPYRVVGIKHDPSDVLINHADQADCPDATRNAGRTGRPSARTSRLGRRGDGPHGERRR